MEYRIYVGADHRGFEKKQELLKKIDGCHSHVKIIDKGAFELNPEDDYNDPAIAVASAVALHKNSYGVLLCGSGHGVCMQANRVPGIRAFNAFNIKDVETSRQEDDVNVICFGTDRLSVDEMVEMVKTFCHTKPNQAEKYLRRARKIDDIIDLDDRDEFNSDDDPGIREESSLDFRNGEDNE